MTRSIIVVLLTVVIATVVKDTIDWKWLDPDVLIAVNGGCLAGWLFAKERA